jgi:ATP-binding cassette subfamily B protein
MKLNPFSKKDIDLFKRTASYVCPYKLRFFWAFVCVLSGIGFGLIQPLVWAKLLTGLFGQNYEILVQVITYMVVLFILITLIRLIQSYLFSSLNQMMIFDIKKDMFHKILNLPIEAFDKMRSGEFMSRLNNDAGVIANLITGQLLSSIINILKVIIIGSAMFFISIKLSLVILIAFPCSYFVFIYFGRVLRKKQSEIAKLNDLYFSTVQESVVGIREIKCLGIKDSFLFRYIKLGEKLKDRGIKIGIFNSFSDVSSQTIKFTTELVAIILGFYLIINGELSVELFIAFMAYSEQFSSSLMELTQLNSNLQQALVSVERIFELLDNLSFSEEKYGKTNYQSIQGNVKFDNVYFNYEDGVDILKGISFEIPQNNTIAFVGGSGVGKTTIFNLILRFYNPIKGKISIDGYNIFDFDEKSLRNNISIVRQEPFLFNMSIKDNLQIATPNVSITEIMEACKSAFIHEYILSLPLGYDSVVGESGVNLSGGQRQRIAIARAILKKSKIILFDEATSSLDNESQFAIKEAIHKLSRACTVIIIAHRLFTVIDADKIYVMDNGVIVGAGVHDNLINDNLIYKKLYQIEVDYINKKQNESTFIGIS